MIICVALIVLVDAKILLVKSKKYDKWYLPGGKVEQGENLQYALMREIKEELNIQLELDDFYYVKSTVAPTHNFDATMLQHCFVLKDAVRFATKIQASAEIEQIDYFSISNYPAVAPAALATLKTFTFI